jgi:hypothetical protein
MSPSNCPPLEGTEAATQDTCVSSIETMVESGSDFGSVDDGDGAGHIWGRSLTGLLNR